MRVRGSVLALACMLVALPAFAADMVGEWSLDKEAFRASARSMMEAQLAESPDDVREQMKQMMEGMLDSMVEEMSGTASFNEDGTVMFVDKEGAVESGTWEDRGDTVLLSNESGESTEARVEGDRMIFSMQEEGMAEPFEMVWKRQ